MVDSTFNNEFIISLGKIETIIRDEMKEYSNRKSIWNCFKKDSNNPLLFANKMEAIYEVITGNIYFILNDKEKVLIKDMNINKVSDLLKAYYKKIKTINDVMFNNKFIIKFESLKSNYNKEFLNLEKIISIHNKIETDVIERNELNRYNKEDDEEIIMAALNNSSSSD